MGQFWGVVFGTFEVEEYVHNKLCKNEHHSGVIMSQKTNIVTKILVYIEKLGSNLRHILWNISSKKGLNILKNALKVKEEFQKRAIIGTVSI